MIVFTSDAHLQHNPPFEIFDGGEKVPNFEVPGRVERVRHALKQAGLADFHEPRDFGLAPLLAVHSADYLDFLQSAYEEWLMSDTDAPYEKSALLPASFPGGKFRHLPKTVLGRAGWYMTDLSAPITAGTYAAALASANLALSAASAVSAGESAAFALCRPPGHHAGAASCAGYCYVNNAAAAANWLSVRGRTAVLDIDYHAGNGTQEIFYERADVLTISIHADPEQEYPYFCGYADETGQGSGIGFHRNLPLPAGTDTDGYLTALKQALDLLRSFDPQYLVLSAGMDIYTGDPLGKFKVSTQGIRRIGQEIARLGTPTVIVMEGGYNNAALGENMVKLLEAFQ